MRNSKRTCGESKALTFPFCTRAAYGQAGLRSKVNFHQAEYNRLPRGYLEDEAGGCWVVNSAVESFEGRSDNLRREGDLLPRPLGSVVDQSSGSLDSQLVLDVFPMGFDGLKAQPEFRSNFARAQSAAQ